MLGQGMMLFGAPFATLGAVGAVRAAPASPAPWGVLAVAVVLAGFVLARA